MYLSHSEYALLRLWVTPSSCGRPHSVPPEDWARRKVPAVPNVEYRISRSRLFALEGVGRNGGNSGKPKEAGASSEIRAQTVE